MISGIQWEFDTMIQLAPGSDLWPTTWAADGNVYTSWGDGGGFGGTDRRGRTSLGFGRLEGPPERPLGENIWGGHNARNSATFNGKCTGIISVGGILYAWINMQNGHPPDVRLAWSTDLGAHWKLTDWAFPKSGRFFPGTFLNFGRDYRGSQDDYVYAYGARWIWAQGPENDLYLARVHCRRILDRTAYEFFSGLDQFQNPIWDKDVASRKPVFTDARGVGNCGLAHVVYLSPIGRYLLTVGHRSSFIASLANEVRRLGVFDAPSPWGPWTTVAYYDDWGGFGPGEALGYNIPAKWIAPDGRTMWMVFSSTEELDAFNMVKFRLLLR
jgi:hypothetical protein